MGIVSHLFQAGSKFFPLFFWGLKSDNCSNLGFSTFIKGPEMLLCAIKMCSPFFNRYYGGWAASNIYFLGFAGVVKFGNIRIGGLSGIYNSRHYHLGWLKLFTCYLCLF